MTKRRNLLRNPSFEQGKTTPTGWEWVVLRGETQWAFDTRCAHSSGRSIRIYQDGTSWHGEFRQKLRCRAGRRYRLSGWIRAMAEGTVVQSGGNLQLRSLAGDKEIDDMYFRPFMVGRQDWQYWWMEYVPPVGTTDLLVSFDMRNAGGQVWFDDLCLSEVPAPAWHSQTICPDIESRYDGPKPAQKVVVLCDQEPAFLVPQVLAPLMGKDNVIVAHDVRRADLAGADALLVMQQGKKPIASWSQLDAWRRKMHVVVTPQVLAGAADGVRLVQESASSLLPAARIKDESFLLHGFCAGDVLPWNRGGPDFVQPGLVASNRTWEKLGLQAIATSAGGNAVLLQGRGLSVMDLQMLDHKPDYLAYENLAAAVLANALGRPQAFFGRFAFAGWPQFDYVQIVARIEAMAKRRAMELKEEGRSGGGPPIYSLSLGQEGAPTLYVDCAIHSDEWTPVFGALLYLDRLAGELEAGRPWAVAALRNLRIKCIPVLSPDGWDVHRRFIRGVDLNRNFPVNWESYRGGSKGSAPLSESEAKIVDRILMQENVVAAISWHETTAGTNWVGTFGQSGRYAKYANAVPAVFRDVIDGRWFSHKAATWTQITDPRNHHFNVMNSWPYIRDYQSSTSPFAMCYANSLGIDAMTLEQYGNADLACSDSIARTDITGRIFEMLLGLQIGLLTRNYGNAPIEVAIPLLASGPGKQSVFAPDGQLVSRRTVRPHSGMMQIRSRLQSGEVLMVELETPPWKRQGGV